jgi:uncharacterized protein YcfJ
MRLVATRFGGAVIALLTAASGATAQSYYDDQACRQYADQAIAPLQNQVNSQAVGSALLGAGLGAALGGAVGGGRGAGIGAASGAVLGGLGGAANAQSASGYLQQQYDAYYAQCKAARSARVPSYSPTPGYAPPASSTSATANDLNRQELNNLRGPAAPPPYPYQPRY